MTLVTDAPGTKAEEIEANRIDGTISHGVLTLRIPLSKAQPRAGADRVDIRDRQCAPQAVSPAS
jgi:hypothetical protein